MKISKAIENFLDYQKMNLKKHFKKLSIFFGSFQKRIW